MTADMEIVLTFLLAGGRGTRLDPLTRSRAKPAVPFGGTYRIIDFALSNCINSQQHRILVLTQYKSLSLERHITLGWGRFFHREFGHWLDVVPPQLRAADDWYLGTANAVYQNLHAVDRSGAGLLLVLASDHVYKLDYRRLLAFHRDHGGVATVAALRFPVGAAAGQLGVLEADAGWRVRAFHEKPACPPPVPGEPTTCLASMGVYVFDARFLAAELRRQAADPDPGHDFGQHVLPRLIRREAVHAYPFEGAYWRDVGTVDTYHQANMDLLTDAPALDLHDQAWPVYGYQPTLPPPTVAVVPAPSGRTASPVRHNIYPGGALVNGWAAGAVIGFNARVAAGAVVTESVLFDDVSVGPGAEVRRAVLDQRVQVRAGARIGIDPEADRRRGFVVTAGGVTRVAEDTVVEPV